MPAMLLEHSPFTILIALGLLAGCQSKQAPAPTANATSSGTVNAATAAAPVAPAAPAARASAAGAAAPSAPSGGAAACSVVGSPVSIAKGARSDTGATAARIADGRLVVGYAVGNVPKASVLDPAAGTATAVDVDAALFASSEVATLEKGSQLAIYRVTPVAATELKMRVLIDSVSTLADKTKRVRCQFGDQNALVGAASEADKDPHASGEQVNNCRSFTDGKKSWILSSSTKPASEGGKPESRWRVHAVAENGTIASETVLGDRPNPEAKQDRYTFDLAASVHENEAGFVFAGRYNGNLALARQAEGSDAVSDLSVTWFGAASGMPALAVADRTVTLIAPLTGKPDLYGITFPIEAKPPKPERITLDGEATASERTSLSILRAGEGTVLGFVEGKRVKLTVLDGALKPKLPTFELPGHDKTVMAKLVPIEAGRVLVLTLDAGEIAATTVECPL